MFFVFVVRQWIYDYFNNESPIWFKEVLEHLYPRLIAEKNRLPDSFLLEKAWQPILRLSLVYYVIWQLRWLYLYSSTFQHKWNSYWSGSTSGKKLSWVIYIIYGGLFLYIYDWGQYIYQIRNLGSFFKPTGFITLFCNSLPSPIVLWSFWGILMSSILFVLFNFKRTFFSILVALCFIFLQGIFFSFEKIDHGYVTYNYALIFLPFCLYTHQNNLWSVRLIQTLIALSYFMSGLEKLLISGMSWLSPTHVQKFFLLHRTPAGEWLLQFEWVFIVLPVIIMLFQLLFPLVLFYRRTIPYFIFGGILFHAGIMFFLHIGAYLHPWILTYAFFFLKDATNIDSSNTISPLKKDR